MARTSVLVVAVLFGLVACRVPEHINPDPTQALGDLRPQTLSKRLLKNPPTTVAVLPFTQAKGESLGAEVMRRSFFNHLSSKKFQDVELYRVDALLRAKGIATAEDLSRHTPQELARILQVEALVYGHISDYGRIIAATVSQVVIGLSVKMVDGRDGAVLWEIEKTSRKAAGGIPLDPISLAMGAINAALNVRAVELLRGADDVCRQVVATLPGPTLSEALRPPQIIALVQDSDGQPKKAGDVIKVSMVGEPGHQATFNIGTYKTNIPMVEDPTAKQPAGAASGAPAVATYVGSYQVHPGDHVRDTLIEARLTDERGNQGRWVDVLSSVTLDTQPPASPRGVEIVGRDAAVVVRWQPNSEKDLAGYQVSRSASPLSGYEVVQQVEVTEVRDVELINLTRYYYKIAAVDRAGNVSPLSDYVSGIPIKAGPTPITADINDDTRWYLGASPYVLQGAVTVHPGVTLTIEPGVTVESAGAGLRVRGSLLAVGTAEAPIVFRAQHRSGAGGSWDGIVFDNTGSRENRIAHAKIQDAKTAVHMTSSSPDIENTLLMKNDTACLVEDVSKPHLKANTIRDNRQDGLVSRHATPTVVQNDITHNGRHGIVLVASAPILTENNIHSNAQMQLAIEGQNAEIVNAQNNWWGTIDREALAQRIAGPASYARVLDRPYPEGRLIAVRPQPPVAARQQPAAPPEPLPVARASLSVDELVSQGKAALAQRRLPEALQAFTQAALLQPENDQLQFQVGLVQYQMGKLEATLAALQKAIALQPQHSEYQYHLGLVYSELGQPEQAIAAWQQVLKLDPTHRNAGMLLKLEQRQVESK